MLMRHAGVAIEFSSVAPAGYYVAVRIGFAFPVEERNHLPPEWVARYTAEGMMLHDPVVKWVYAHTGAIRWSTLESEDSRGVLHKAAQYGLRYGVAVCCRDRDGAGLRSFGMFARADREYANDEIALLQLYIRQLHDSLTPPKNLTHAELEALAMVKNGLLVKEIASALQISEGAVKQRLRNVKTKLGAKTSVQAVTLASDFGLI